MTRKTQADWLTLIQEHQTSGLSQSAFCRGKGLAPKYFSKRKADLQKTTTPFVAIRREVPVRIQVWHKDTKVSVSDCSPLWLGQLLRELAQ